MLDDLPNRFKYEKGNNLNKSTNPIEYLLTGLIVALISIQLIIPFIYAWPFTTDDAFISWRYADHLAHGNGLLWNLQQAAVEGYSNFAWVIIVSLLIACGLPIVTMVKIIACLCLLSSLIFLYQLARSFLSPLMATLPIYLFSHYQGIVWWTVSGLETSLFMTLAIFSSLQALRAMGFHHRDKTYLLKYQPAHWMGCCLGLTLMALARFDGVLWAPVILAFILCCLSKAKAWRYLGHLTLIFVLFFILPYALYFSWRLYYFSQWIPNSFVCKSMSSFYHVELINDYLFIAFPCFILSLPYLLYPKDCKPCLLWLPSLIYLVLLYKANPNIAYYNRHFLAAFSLFSLLPVLGIQQVLDFFKYTSGLKALLSTVIIILFSHFFIPGNHINLIRTEVIHYQQRSAMREEIAAYLSAHVPPNGQVLLADCGIIPFYSRHDIQFIDSLCLNNKEMTSMSGDQYNQYLQQRLKPEWIVDTYYPDLHHGNMLNETLKQKGFYNNYTLVKQFQSHAFAFEQGTIKEKAVDFVYLIYQRNNQ